jgi:hypothetical protein
MPFLVDVRHLHRAARACMHRASSPGADAVSWADYRQGLRERLADLAARLRSGTWAPTPPRLVDIATYSGKVFTAAIPTVEERVVHRAMRAAAEPILEARLYADWVSGYRPGRNRLTAVRQAAAHMAGRRCWVADVDVAGASAGATVDQLLDWLARHVHDGTFLARVRTALQVLPAPLIPGTGLWPMLFHLRLAQVDAQLADLPVVRFADNYTVFCSDASSAREAFGRVGAALATVGLAAHPGKSKVRAPGTANPEDLYLIDG